MKVKLEAHAELACLLSSAIHDQDYKLQRQGFTPNLLTAL